MKSKFNDGLKVLVYGNVDKMGANTNHHFLDQLEKVSDFMTQEPKTIEDLNELILNSKYTHVVVPDEHFHQLNGSLEKCVVPVVELLGDHYVPWAIERKRNYLIENGIKDAFVFSNRFHEDYKDVVKFHTVLTGFDYETFFDKNKERDIDVLMSGATKLDKPWIYPVRVWLNRVLPEIAVKEGINVEFLNHPGRMLEKGQEKITKAYSDVLNRTKIATGGSSFWKLPLKKFYEIPACGAILLSDLPMEDTDFFKDKILEIDASQMYSKKYEDLLRKKVMDVLENYDFYKEDLKPIRTLEDGLSRDYSRKALEMRAILKSIKK